MDNLFPIWEKGERYISIHLHWNCLHFSAFDYILKLYTSVISVQFWTLLSCVMYLLYFTEFSLKYIIYPEATKKHPSFEGTRNLKKGQKAFFSHPSDAFKLCTSAVRRRKISFYVFHLSFLSELSLVNLSGSYVIIVVSKRDTVGELRHSVEWETILSDSWPL